MTPLCMKPTYIYMLGAKHRFVQSVDCAAQIVDPYFARAIHGLRSHSVRIHPNCARLSRKVGCDAYSVHVHGLYKPARPVVYHWTGSASKPGNQLFAHAAQSMVVREFVLCVLRYT